MGTTSPARIDDDLYAWAKAIGDVQSRSAAQQVAHWARIGREIEASESISHRAIGEALAGSRSYDSLDAKEQAVVRAAWSERLDEVRAALDFTREFAASGRTWVELDDEGRVVERGQPSEASRKRPTREPRTRAAASAGQSGNVAKGKAAQPKIATARKPRQQSRKAARSSDAGG